MTGNDLVDLKQASIESNWKRKGYLEKVFTSAEQHLILYAAKPDVLVWLLWSMKEAAYKIHNRRSGVREYAPLKLNCRLSSNCKDCITGTVQIDGITYLTKSIVQGIDYIHTHAAETEQEMALIREQIYPYGQHSDYKAMAPSCVSHHGRYLALIF